MSGSVASAVATLACRAAAELPALTAIGAEWQAEAQYFAEQATVFLGESAWGMVAAPLGNAEKRREFRQRFWWGDAGLHALLQSLERDPPPVGDWQAAVNHFAQALGSAATLAADRAAADTALRYPVGDGHVRDAQHEAERAGRQLTDAEEELKRVTGAVTGLRQAVQALKGETERHGRSRPGGVRGLLGIGPKIAAWHERRNDLETELAHRIRELRGAQQRADQVSAQVAAARQGAIDTARDAEALISRRADGEQRIRLARETWGPVFPEHWLELDQNAQERAAPWSDEEWTTARTRVFLAALDLHRAFIAGAAGTIRRNLLQLIAALAREPGAPPPDAERAAWQTLFPRGSGDLHDLRLLRQDVRGPRARIARLGAGR